jgi:phage terminase large subunit
MMRVEAARRLFPAIHFNEPTCKAGLDALGWYHEKTDEARGIGLGPEHDWSSHAADAFGLMCVAHKFPEALYEDEDDDRDRGRNQETGY